MTGLYDNRMAWVRNIEKLEKSDKNYLTEYEVATECHIPGILNYGNGKILCGGLANKTKNGLYHYLFRIQYAGFEEPCKEQTRKKGYYFKDGILGELLSLFSLYFQCRFYLVATYFGELTEHGLKYKMDNDFLYRSCSHQIHPKMFENNKNRIFGQGLTRFLDSIKSLKPAKHKQFILACYHYARSLKEVGIDSEMVFIRLVSSIEALSKDFDLRKKDNPLNGENFYTLFKNCKITEPQRKQIKEILRVSKNGLIHIEKSKLKFIKFIEEHSKGSLKGGNFKVKRLKIKKGNLPEVLKKIYDVRSAYLHNGEPMFLSQFMHKANKWDTDPCCGMIIDNVEIPVSKKLPYTYWFENVVRCSLLNYLNDKQNK